MKKEALALVCLFAGLNGVVWAEGLKREALRPGTLPGMVLEHNVRYCVDETFRVDASGLPGMSALRVAPGAAVVLDIAKDESSLRCSFAILAF